MSPAQVFSLANTVALITWLTLVVFHRRAWARDRVVPVAVALFATAYATIIVTRWGQGDGGFDTLEGVSRLFADPWLLLAGWLHYLAFDLLVGRWEAADAASRGIRWWLVAPCLGLTFMFGPAGWLGYMLVRRVAPLRSASGA